MQALLLSSIIKVEQCIEATHFALLCLVVRRMSTSNRSLHGVKVATNGTLSVHTSVVGGLQRLYQVQPESGTR
jgi:hypothetical protein